MTTEALKLPWSETTMRMINDLTPSITGKAFDPGWFKLRERFEQVDQRDATLREHVRILRAALTLFCERRDRGEVRSVTTYKQFKQLLEITK
jgi:hypothetical protein